MKKNVKINKLESTLKEETDCQKTKKENPILTELRELKVQLNEVTAMKTEIADLRKQMNQKGDNSKSKFKGKFGCPDCRKNNVRRCSGGIPAWIFQKSTMSPNLPIFAPKCYYHNTNTLTNL